MSDALRRHWPEYAMEALCLGLFMLAAVGFTTVLEHPASPLRAWLPNSLPRRALMGLAMGATAIGLIYSPWGRRSGAHMNPSVTLAFLRLGKVAPWDAAFYVAAQFLGGLAGVAAARGLAGMLPADPAVGYAATRPGPGGVGPAFAGELAISFLLMTTVLVVSNQRRLMHLTGLSAGLLVALYITLEAPISGMSMNPARTVASAVPAGVWQAVWIYFVAPPLGMLLAAEIYLAVQGRRGVICAKLDHGGASRCIFRCGV